MRSSRPFRHWFRILLGCSLLVGGIFGAVYGVRVGVAHYIYHRAKFGLFEGTCLAVPPLKDSGNILPLVEDAHKLYPHNYYFAIYAAQRALYDVVNGSDPDIMLRRFKSAEYWCRTAMDINPYNFEVFDCHRRLLIEKGDIDEAIRFWRDVVLEREFWNPKRHTVMAELYLKAGMRSKAAEERVWVPRGELRNSLTTIHKKIESAAER